MCRGQQKNAENAPGIRFNVLAAVAPQQRNRTLILTGKLNDTGRSPRMKAQAMPNDNFPLRHAGFFGASSSLAR